MRGQVTIFVIIGLAVLLVAGIVVLTQQDEEPSLATSQDAVRVTQLVQSCLDTVGEEVLREIGTTGGYFTTSQFKDTDGGRDSQVVSVPPQKVVLWHEIHPCNNPTGCVGNNRPPLCARGERCGGVPYTQTDSRTSIQEELERGIEQRIDACLDFSQLPDLQVERNGEPEVKATVREDNIALALSYPLNIKYDEGDVDVERYSAELDVALPELYRFATRIQAAEQNQTFLEGAFLQLLGAYSGSDSTLPPFREVELFGSPRYWVRTEVKESIEQDILPFMNFVQIADAQESFAPVLAPEVEDAYRPYAEGYYEALIVKLGNEPKPYAVQVEYPYAPIFLDINGKELLRPQQFGGGGFLAQFAGMVFMQYKFRYNVEFPVIVHLSDPAAFDGRGYRLDFGLEANIRNNRPLNVSAPVVQLTGTDAIIDLSDPRQLVNHTYTIRVSDKHMPTKAVSGASINYECDVRYYIGETDADGIWTGKLPYCFTGGILTIQHQQYLASGMELSNVNEDGTVSSHEMSMWPRKEKSITIYKLTEQDVNELFSGMLRVDARSQLGQNDSVILEMVRRKESAYEDDVPLGGILQFGKQGRGVAGNIAVDELLNDLEVLRDAEGMDPATYEELRAALLEQAQRLEQEGVNASFKTTVTADLVPGDYSLQGTLIYTGLIQIPEKKESGTLGLGAYTLPAQNYTSWVSGGLVWTGSDVLRLSAEDIYSDTNITIYVLEQKLPQKWDDIQSYQQLEEYQNTYGRKEFVRPQVEG